MWGKLLKGISIVIDYAYINNSNNIDFFTLACFVDDGNTVAAPVGACFEFI